MPIYAVDIRIHVCGYEKCTQHIIEADDEQIAEYQALCDETHNEPLTWKQFLKDEQWEDDIFVYTIDNVVEIGE